MEAAERERERRRNRVTTGTDDSPPGSGSRQLAMALVVGMVLLLGALAAPVALAVNGGDLDPSFDGDGRLTTDFSGFGYPDFASAVAIQADGKVVVAGDALGGFALARYNPDGSLDTSFAGDGTRWTLFGSGEDSAASAVAIQADGKIVAVGSWYRGAGNHDFALARFNPDGSLDTSFSGDGKRTQGFGGSDRAHGVAIQADGKIVVAGVGDGDFALARYNPDSSLDTSFSGDGTLTTPFFGDTSITHAVAIQADGRIVAAGTRVASSDYDFALARYNPNGSLDTAFSGDGILTTSITGADDEARAVAIQADGKIVAAGGLGGFLLARYNADGSLDTSFDGDGTSNSFSARAAAVGIQADGRIVAAGTAGGDFVLARYNPYGGLDPSFSDDGRLTTDFGGSDVGAGLAIQADGRIVVAGTANADFALARYYASAPETAITSEHPVLSADPASTDGTVTIEIKGKRAKLGRKRRVVVRLACPAQEASPPCSGTLRLKTARKVRFAGKTRRPVLAERRYTIGAGETRGLKLKLSKRKAKLVRSRKRARRVRAIAHVADQAGNRATAVKQIRLRPIATGRKRGG
jgi:uncharacterized delta-60 repeat protein